MGALFSFIQQLPVETVPQQTHPRAVNVDVSPESLSLSLERGIKFLANGFGSIVTNYLVKLEPSGSNKYRCLATPTDPRSYVIQ